MRTILAGENEAKFYLSTSIKHEIPWLLLGGSILSAIILLVKRSRQIVAWLLPLSLAGAGTALYLMQRRTSIIDEKEAQILIELESLDPVARAQVLIRVTEKELGRYK